MTLSSSPTIPVPWRHADVVQCVHAGGILEIIGQRWTPGILFALARGAERFTEIAGAVNGLSARMLTVRLKQLEQGGLVERTVRATTPVTVTYRLTPRGDDLLTALEPLSGYVERWGDVVADPSDG